MFSDFNTIYQWGVELQKGNYIGIYPLPATILFSLLAFLPQNIALFFLISVSVVILVLIFKYKSIIWLFYWPILETLMLGQIDILFLGLYYLDTPLSLALMTLKPQLFILAIPKLISGGKQKLFRFMKYVVILWGIPTIFRPFWILEWFKNMDDGRLSHNNSASVFAVPILFLFIFIVILIGKKNWKAIGLVLNLGVRPYDYVFLAGSDIWLIPLSYFIFYITYLIKADWPTIFLGLFVILGRPINIFNKNKYKGGGEHIYGISS